MSHVSQTVGHALDEGDWAQAKTPICRSVRELSKRFTGEPLPRSHLQKYNCKGASSTRARSLAAGQYYHTLKQILSIILGQCPPRVNARLFAKKIKKICQNSTSHMTASLGTLPESRRHVTRKAASLLTESCQKAASKPAES